MSTLRRLINSKRSDPELDDGVALPFVAIMLALLLGVSAFAVDLGWLYLNGSRLQRAADSAALAGVVYLPANQAGAQEFAVNGATANGWNIGTVNGDPIGGGGPDTLNWRQIGDNRMEVTLRASVRTFFLPVLGFDSFDLTRTATAEYSKPIPIGSPYPCFGNAPGVPECPESNFWAAIQMPYTAKEHGDPFQALCITANAANPPGNCVGGQNPQYRPGGYYYAIEVADNANSLTVNVYDATFMRRSDPPGQNSCTPWPPVETGDCDVLGNTNRITTGSGFQNTNFQLYAPDDTPLDPTDNDPISGCLLTAGRNDPFYLNAWRPVCTIPSPEPGIYVLRVWTDSNSGGSNQYSLRALTPGADQQVRVYGINDVSIFTNQSGTLMNMYLAEVEELHAGKTLELNLYDVGEDQGEAWMTFQMPGGVVPTCTWVATNEAGSQTASGSGSCSIQTSAASGPLRNRFNGEWLRIQMEIPGNYTCGSDCWWRVEIENNTPHDRTTWAARVIGNPVQLVPNEP